MTKLFCVKILYQKFLQVFIVFYPNPYFTLYDEYFYFTHIFFQWYWNWASIFFQWYSFCVLPVRISCWVSFGAFMFLLICIRINHCLECLHSLNFTTPVTLFSLDLSNMLLLFLPFVLLHKVNRKPEGWELMYLLT